MTFPRRLGVVSAALLLGALTASCGRRSENIGRVITGTGGVGGGNGGSGGSSDGPFAPDHGEGAMGGDGGVELAAAACDPPATAVLPASGDPGWNCNPRCRRELDFVIEQGLLDSSPVDPTRAPVLVYPLAGSVHPVNLARLTVQWRRAPGGGQSQFRIRIAPASGTPYDLYVARKAPPPPAMAQESDVLYEIPEAVWRTIARDNAGAAVSLTVTAYDTLSMSTATSLPVAINFSARPLEGGLNFLATEPPQAGINRHLFGARGAHLLVARSPNPGAMDCVGCHSTSRDGKLLAYADTYAGNLAVVATASMSPPIVEPRPTLANGLSPAVSPDGKRVLARDNTGNVTIYDGVSGLPMPGALRAELGGRIDYPEWSLDGAAIVATRSSAQPPSAPDYSASDGQLVIIRYEANRLVLPPRVLLSDPQQAFSHPSWSPDGKWIVFVSSPAGQETHRQARTRLRLISVEDQPRVFTLDRASAGDQAATYPKFAPTGQDGCQSLFVAFQSRLTYGLFGARADPIWPQLWMTALDLRNSAPGSDPSSPPVWLPFQDIANKNLLPAWSALVPCGATLACGEGSTCNADGQCVVAPQ